jgi:hypothetical protein
MSTSRLTWIVVAVLLCSAGGYLVFDSVRDTGHLADASVLLGGTLIGVALFALSVAVQQHLQVRAMAKHMRRVHESRLR